MQTHANVNKKNSLSAVFVAVFQRHYILGLCTLPISMLLFGKHAEDVEVSIVSISSHPPWLFPFLVISGFYFSDVSEVR